MRPGEILFRLGNLSGAFGHLPAAFAELEHGPTHVEAGHAVIVGKERSPILIFVLREDADLGNVFGARGPQRGPRLFELMAGGFEFWIVPQSRGNGRFDFRRRRRTRAVQKRELQFRINRQTAEVGQFLLHIGDGVLQLAMHVLRLRDLRTYFSGLYLESHARHDRILRFGNAHLGGADLGVHGVTAAFGGENAVVHLFHFVGYVVL